MRFLCVINKKPRVLIYFLVQSIGTLGLLASIIVIPSLLFIFLILKLGFFPFYYWMVKILISERYWRGGILLTWQKLAPLILLCYYNIFHAIFIINALVGVYILFHSNHILIILLFSGLTQGSWVIIIIPAIFSFTYFLIYSFIIMILLSNNFTRASFFLTFMSLAGFPPLTGFIIKLKAIPLLPVSVLVILLVLSVLPMFCYLRFILLHSINSSRFTIIALLGALIGLALY